MKVKSAAALFVVLSALCGLAPPCAARQESRETLKENRLLAVGASAPGWTLADPSGARHTLAEYRGKLVVLDFWATWCKPCEKLMPRLQKLHEQYAARGVLVFGVNSWERGDPAALLSRKRISYGQLLKGEEIAADYGVINLPVVYVIGTDGTVIYRHEGVGGEDLSRVIEKHLKERGM